MQQSGMQDRLPRAFQQQTPLPDIPNDGHGYEVTVHQQPRYERRNEREWDFAAMTYRWVWPTFSWAILGYSLVFMTCAVRDMFAAQYSSLTHLSAIIFTGLAFVIVAGVYRYILCKPLIDIKLPVEEPEKA